MKQFSGNKFPIGGWQLERNRALEAAVARAIPAVVIVGPSLVLNIHLKSHSPSLTPHHLPRGAPKRYLITTTSTLKRYTIHIHNEYHLLIQIILVLRRVTLLPLILILILLSAIPLFPLLLLLTPKLYLPLPYLFPHPQLPAHYAPSTSQNPLNYVLT